MPTPGDPHHDPRRPFQLDRRGFLLASSGAILGSTLLLGCSGSETGKSASTTTPAATGAVGAGGGPRAATAAAALAAPGSAGLMAEQVYQQRVDAYLAFATTEAKADGLVGIAARLIRAAREPAYTWDVASATVDSLADEWTKIDTWQDTRDFALMYMHWLPALGQGTTPMTRLSDDLLAAIKKRHVANRYRYDDPLPADRVDNQWFWSENHRLIGLANEYLAGQRFPDETFTVTGLTGAKHMARAKPDILEWVHERATLGFFEWHSNVYMLKNVTPLLMLAELADDPEIVTAAGMALDLCLLDMAAHLQNGCFTAPRGRTYKKDKMSSLDEDTFGTTKFMFDDTKAEYPSKTDGGATYFCAATRYRPPQVLVDIATADRTSVVRERHGVYFDGSAPVTEHPKAPYDRDFESRANLPFWWSLGAVGMWPLAKVSVEAANEFRLWDTELFAQIKLLAALNDFDPVKIAAWAQARAAVINFGFLSEANTYAWRAPEVSLATVVDHRFGAMRDQVHAWQAAIDENAMVFTTHPVTDPKKSTDWSDDADPGYWTGTASMPRSAQFERTAVHIYQPGWDKATDPLVWSAFEYRDFTHAYVPQDHFDQVRQTGHWTVAERAGAYIALWSWRTPTWRTYDPAVYATRGMVKPFDLVAEGGPDNVWIVEVGTAKDAGDLDTFVASLTKSDPTVTRTDAGFTVAWQSPSAGQIGFGSTGAFTVAGKEQSLKDFPRHDSPWGTVDHLATTYALHSDQAKWTADYDALSRSVS